MIFLHAYDIVNTPCRIITVKCHVYTCMHALTMKHLQVHTHLCMTGYFFCISTHQFYQLGITHPSYVFITHGWYQSHWWSQEVSRLSLNCSDADMTNMLHGVIAVQQFPVANSGSHPTASGLVRNECRLICILSCSILITSQIHSINLLIQSHFDRKEMHVLSFLLNSL